MEKVDSAKQKENEDREKIINFLRKNGCWLELGYTCGWVLMLFLVVLNVFRACNRGLMVS